MKLGDVRQAASERLDVLFQRKTELSDLLKEGPSGTNGTNFDRVEISKELSAVENEYEQMQGISEKLSELEMGIRNAEAARQQGETLVKAAEDMLKILEIFRRISNGDRVPLADENRLLEYSHELYMSAKNMAFLKENDKPKKYDSLWDEEDQTQEPQPDPDEVAANTEVGNPLLSVASSSGAADESADP
ncbi:MAG: hypothetical protein Q3Y08_05950 [Butyricicoccus sp.]|nr:hypothetical protein [Butyricicoccus sp.]